MSDSKRENPFQRSVLIIEVPELELGSEVSEEILRKGEAESCPEEEALGDGQSPIRLVEIVEEASNPNEEDILAAAQATGDIANLLVEVSEEIPSTELDCADEMLESPPAEFHTEAVLEAKIESDLSELLGDMPDEASVVRLLSEEAASVSAEDVSQASELYQAEGLEEESACEERVVELFDQQEGSPEDETDQREAMVRAFQHNEKDVLTLEADGDDEHTADDLAVLDAPLAETLSTTPKEDFPEESFDSLGQEMNLDHLLGGAKELTSEAPEEEMSIETQGLAALTEEENKKQPECIEGDATSSMQGSSFKSEETAAEGGALAESAEGAHEEIVTVETGVETEGGSVQIATSSEDESVTLNLSTEEGGNRDAEQEVSAEQVEEEPLESGDEAREALNASQSVEGRSFQEGPTQEALAAIEQLQEFEEAESELETKAHAEELHDQEVAAEGVLAEVDREPQQEDLSETVLETAKVDSIESAQHAASLEQEQEQEQEGLREIVVPGIKEGLSPWDALPDLKEAFKGKSKGDRVTISLKNLDHIPIFVIEELYACQIEWEKLGVQVTLQLREADFYPEGLKVRLQKKFQVKFVSS